ncbi:hypothetical protein ACFLRW_05640 [Acidobacteriota bacterium]
MTAGHSTDMEPPVIGFGNFETEGIVVLFGTSNQNCPLPFQGVFDQLPVTEV